MNFIVLLQIQLVFGVIIRTENKNSAMFNKNKLGKLLSVPIAVLNIDYLKCLSECSRNTICETVNFNIITNQCELIKEEFQAEVISYTKGWYCIGTASPKKYVSFYS